MRSRSFRFRGLPLPAGRLRRPPAERPPAGNTSLQRVEACSGKESPHPSGTRRTRDHTSGSTLPQGVRPRAQGAASVRWSHADETASTPARRPTVPAPGPPAPPPRASSGAASPIHRTRGRRAFGKTPRPLAVTPNPAVPARASRNAERMATTWASSTSPRNFRVRWRFSAGTQRTASPPNSLRTAEIRSATAAPTGTPTKTRKVDTALRIVYFGGWEDFFSSPVHTV